MLVLGREPSPLEEQVLVTTDPSLQPLSLVFFNVRINHSGYVTSASAVLISTVEKHMQEVHLHLPVVRSGSGLFLISGSWNFGGSSFSLVGRIHLRKGHSGNSHKKNLAINSIISQFLLVFFSIKIC